MYNPVERLRVMSDFGGKLEDEGYTKRKDIEEGCFGDVIEELGQGEFIREPGLGEGLDTKIDFDPSQHFLVKPKDPEFKPKLIFYAFSAGTPGAWDAFVTRCTTLQEQTDVDFQPACCMRRKVSEVDDDALEALKDHGYVICTSESGICELIEQKESTDQ